MNETLISLTTSNSASSIGCRTLFVTASVEDNFVPVKNVFIWPHIGLLRSVLFCENLEYAMYVALAGICYSYTTNIMWLCTF
jgi:hypothetical protein